MTAASKESCLSRTLLIGRIRPKDNVAVSDVRALLGLLSKDGDIGLFVTSGSFSNESERLARESHVHIRLIDFENFISLWQACRPIFLSFHTMRFGLGSWIAFN